MAETDQVKFRGIRPVQPLENIFTQIGANEVSSCGITRTIITKSLEVENTTAIIHTVTAGKTFYLCNAFICASSGVAKTNTLYVRNVADVTQYAIFCAETAAQQTINAFMPYNFPIPIAAGFDVVGFTDNTTMTIFIHGWEQ